MILDDTTFPLAIAALRRADPDLEAIHARFGPPPLWAREPGFSTLVRIILEQQVSLASAAAAFDRLTELIQTVTPANLLRLSDADLKACGFSRQKTGYARGLAGDILAGRLDLAGMENMNDHEARSALTGVRGVGPWSADIYLLMALRRADVWPSGDLALEVSMMRIKNLPSRPTRQQMEEISLAWAPWRAAAARFLWHDYLSR